MKKDVLIKIKGVSNPQDPDSEVVELTTIGQYYKKQGEYVLSYDESSMTGMEDTKTTVKICDSGVSVTREGKFPSNMLFEKDKQHTTAYSTEYGHLLVSVVTDKIEQKFDEHGGKLFVGYSLDFDHNYVGKNQLTIDVVQIIGGSNGTVTIHTN